MVILTYDPNSPSEQPVSLPSAPLVPLSENAFLQPPLTRRGTGPGVIMFLPPTTNFNPRAVGVKKPLDPEPVQKWAEEGFAVVGVTTSSLDWSPEESLKGGIKALLNLKELDTNDKFAVIVYDPKVVQNVTDVILEDPRVVCLVVYGLVPEKGPNIPSLVHLAAGHKSDSSETLSKFHVYPAPSPYFVLPHAAEYDPGSAAIAHSRSLVFLRKWLGGPTFDLEAIWDEHTYFEFEDRSVAKTMGTMVAEPYVNHVPTMTGGVGREKLTAFYRDHFIFSNAADAAMQTVSRTVGPDRVVDEFVLTFTHDRVVDWLLPGVPPTGRKMTIPVLAVVNIRGDRLYHEHIWWDQGTALLQAGVLPTYLPYPGLEGPQTLRLPIAGPESARMLIDEVNGESNEMFGSDWGVQSVLA